MRVPMRLAAAMTAAALLIPTAALAGHRSDDDWERSSRRGARVGMLTFDNPNLASLEVMVDRERVATIAPGSVERVRVPPGEHKVVVRFRQGPDLRVRVLKEKVWVGPGQVQRFRLPLMSEGLLTVRNEWIEPMDLVIDGRMVGTVAARGSLTTLAAGRTRVKLVDPAGRLALRTRVELGGLQEQAVTLIPDRTGLVEVYNPTDRRMGIVDSHGERLARVAPGLTILRLPVGRTFLTAQRRGQKIDQTRLIVSPFGPARFDVQVPTTAPLTFRNDGRREVEVYAGSRYLGRVAAGSTAIFRDAPVGSCELTVRVARRRGFVESQLAVVVDPFEGGYASIRLDARDGRRGHHAGNDRPRQSRGRWAWSR